MPDMPPSIVSEIGSGIGSPGTPPVRSPEKSIERPAKGFPPKRPLPLPSTDSWDGSGDVPFLSGEEPFPLRGSSVIDVYFTTPRYPGGVFLRLVRGFGAGGTPWRR